MSIDIINKLNDLLATYIHISKLFMMSVHLEKEQKTKTRYIQCCKKIMMTMCFFIVSVFLKLPT